MQGIRHIWRAPLYMTTNLPNAASRCTANPSFQYCVVCCSHISVWHAVRHSYRQSKQNELDWRTNNAMQRTASRTDKRFFIVRMHSTHRVRGQVNRRLPHNAAVSNRSISRTSSTALPPWKATSKMNLRRQGAAIHQPTLKNSPKPSLGNSHDPPQSLSNRTHH